MARDTASGTAPQLDVSLSRPGSGPAGEGPEHLRKSFGEALNAGELGERTYSLAGSAVRLRFASEQIMDRLARSFAHLELNDDPEPALTVCLWDSSGSGVTSPPLPPVEFSEAERGGVVHYSDGPVRALYQPALQSLSMLDEAAGEGWFWTESAAALPEWECATPLRHILHWWLAQRGIQQVHGGAVGTENGGVLVVGKGGSGKSTISVASVAAGLLYAGDDYVTARVDGEPYIYSLYNSGKIEAGRFERFPEILGSKRVDPFELERAAPFDREKTVVYLHETHPDLTTSGFPLRAIVIPRISSEHEATLERASRIKALAALGPSTIMQLHTAGQDALASMRRLVESVPAYELVVGSDLTSPAKAISALLSDLDRDGKAAR